MVHSRLPKRTRELSEWDSQLRPVANMSVDRSITIIVMEKWVCVKEREKKEPVESRR